MALNIFNDVRRTVTNIYNCDSGTKVVLMGLGTGSLLFVLLGVDPSSDVLVHAGGFLGGVVAGASAALIPDGRRAIASRISAVLFAAVVATTWVLALR